MPFSGTPASAGGYADYSPQTFSHPTRLREGEERAGPRVQALGNCIFSRPLRQPYSIRVMPWERAIYERKPAAKAGTAFSSATSHATLRSLRCALCPTGVGKVCIVQQIRIVRRCVLKKASASRGQARIAQEAQRGCRQGRPPHGVPPTHRRRSLAATKLACCWTADTRWNSRFSHTEQFAAAVGARPDLITFLRWTKAPCALP